MPFSTFKYADEAVPGLKAIYRWAYRQGGRTGFDRIRQALKDHIKAVQHGWDPEADDGQKGEHRAYLTPFADGRFMLSFSVAEEDPGVLVLADVKEMPQG